MELKTCTICNIEREIKNFPLRADFDNKKRRGDCRFCINTRTRNKWRQVREQIFNHYGWECKCCGETIREFLSLDHINNDGYLDKNPNGDKKSGKELYSLVIKQGFPDKYQTLCMNCNWGKKVSGICPHKLYE